MLKQASVAISALLSLLLLHAIISDKADKMKMAYLIFFCINTLFAFYINHFGNRLRWRTRVIGALCNFFVLSFLALVIYISVYGAKAEPGVFFAPFMIALAMIFIRRSRESLTMITVATLVFLLLSNHNKPSYIFRIDLDMAIVAWCLSIFVNLESLHLWIRDYRLRNELVRLSCTDSLTGLMNKGSAESAARHYLSGQGVRECSALFVIDMDQFKQINDVLGHQAGDEALEVFGETLIKLFRAQDVVGRVGGDEFVALMKNISDAKLVARRAATICNAVRHTKLKNYNLSITCSVGVAIASMNHAGYDEMFKLADEQLYRVKRGGRDGFLIGRV